MYFLFIHLETAQNSMLTYKKNEIQTSKYSIFTIWYENLKWQQYDSQNSRLYYAGTDTELISEDVACTSGNLSISSIYIFTLDGWVRWTGSYQNIFTLLIQDTSYSIKVIW